MIENAPFIRRMDHFISHYPVIWPGQAGIICMHVRLLGQIAYNAPV